MNVRTLRKGISPGDDVKRSQVLLRALGYLPAGHKVGSSYGQPNRSAVYQFKKATKGLPADSTLGPKAWAALERAYARKTGQPVAHVTMQGDGIDPAALRHVVPSLSPARATAIAEALTPAFRKYGIVTPLRAAAAIAQFAHESDAFRTTTEYASGAEYEGRHDLGNTYAGDGRRFKGRGFIQVTGRANYAAVSQAFGHDFLTHPDDLALFRWAAVASAWWWSAHGCSGFADRGWDGFTDLTRRINGGTNGLGQREAYYRRAREVASRLVP